MLNYTAEEFSSFVLLMGQAAEITAGGKPMSKGAAQLMYSLLRGDLTHEQVVTGIKAHINSTGGRFMPTPADIRRHTNGTDEERGQLAWRFFKAKLERYGFYDSVRFPHPAYHYAVEQLGGWRRIGEEWHSLTDKEIEFRGKDFIKLYLIGERVASWYAEHGKVRVRPYLAGFHEIDSAAKDFTKAIPEIIDVTTGNKVDRRELPHIFTERALRDTASADIRIGEGTN